MDQIRYYYELSNHIDRLCKDFRPRNVTSKRDAMQQAGTIFEQHAARIMREEGVSYRKAAKALGGKSVWQGIAADAAAEVLK